MAIPFVPRPEQLVVIRSLLEDPYTALFIIKSRRLGMSTAIGIMQADFEVFTSGHRGVIIDQNQGDATKKLVEIVRFAIDNLPEALRGGLIVDKANEGELRMRRDGEGSSEDSVIWASVGTRGGDCSFLHVSEWGPISFLDKMRSVSIRTGTWPSARRGRRVVETTWMGGKGGDLWEMIKPILEGDPSAEGKVLFFPWHCDPAAVNWKGHVSAETERYFADLSARTGKEFSRGQKAWYAARKLELGIYVKREYPSTLDEALSAPIEGAIYGDDIDRAYGDGRICDVPIDEGSLIHTFWDLGSPRNTSVWYGQFVGREFQRRS